MPTIRRVKSRGSRVREVEDDSTGTAPSGVAAEMLAQKLKNKQKKTKVGRLSFGNEEQVSVFHYVAGV